MLTTLIDEGLICLELAAHDKQALFVELAARLKASGKIASEEQFVRDLWAREELDNTGFEQGSPCPTPRARRCESLPSWSASAAGASTTAPKMASPPSCSS